MRKIAFEDVCNVMSFRAAFIHSSKVELLSESSLRYQLSMDFFKTIKVEPFLTKHMNNKFGPRFQSIAVKKQVNDKDPSFSFMMFSPQHEDILYELEVFYDQDIDSFDIFTFVYSVNAENIESNHRIFNYEPWMLEMEKFFQQLLLNLPRFRLYEATKGIQLRYHTVNDIL